MKVLAVVSALDLKYRYGCTPAWWQLFKGLYEEGVEVVATPYQGLAIESLWWRTYPNPCYWEGEFFWHIKNLKKQTDKEKTNPLTCKNSDLTPGEKRTLFFIRNWIRKKWIKHIKNILRKEKDFEAVIIFTVPANHLNGVPSNIREEFQIPVIYYDGDVPSSLPSSSGYNTGFRIYQDSNPSEFDGFICNSVAGVDELTALGARRVLPLMWGADPQVYYPKDIPYRYDVSFYGYGYEYREEWIENMLVEPSAKLADRHFVLGGRGFDGIDTGKVTTVENIPFSSFRNFCCASKINLNITRKSHASFFASSSVRPFELASMECCIVSNPVMGIEEWFDVGKEILLIHSKEEAIICYKDLLKDDKWRKQIASAARKRVLAEHTYRHRAKQLISYLHSF